MQDGELQRYYHALKYLAPESIRLFPESAGTTLAACDQTLQTAPDLTT